MKIDFVIDPKSKESAERLADIMRNLHKEEPSGCSWVCEAVVDSSGAIWSVAFGRYLDCFDLKAVLLTIDETIYMRYRCGIYRRTGKLNHVKGHFVKWEGV